MSVDFQPHGLPSGHTFEEMKQNFEQLGAKEFVSHVCAKRAHKASALIPGSRRSDPSKLRGCTCSYLIDQNG